MENIYLFNNRPASLKLFVTTDEDSNVNVRVTIPLYNSFAKSFVVQKGRVHKVDLPLSIMGSTGIENKGVHVVADDDVIVYAINKEKYSTDAFIVLPIAALGQEYYVLAWSQNSAFMVIGTEDQTRINIKLGQYSPSISHGGSQIYPGGSITVLLNKFQTFFLKSFFDEFGDFSGTHIYSDKPVTVLGGSVGASIGLGARDHMVQQLIPITKWGKDFVTVSMPGCKSSDTFKVVGSFGSTTVNISGMTPQRIVNSGDFFDFQLSDLSSKTVSADKPITLALFVNGGCAVGDIGDPAMILIPAIQQFSSDYTFATVSLDGGDFVNSIGLVIADSYINGLRFDRQSMPATTWRAVEGRPDIKYTELGITSGVHSITHTDKKVTFLALSTGVQSFNSYGYPAGFDFRHSVKVCSSCISLLNV